MTEPMKKITTKNYKHGTAQKVTKMYINTRETQMGS